MSLKSLLLSSDEKTVRVLRRVLSDLDIEVEHCSGAEAAIRKLTRQRFEAIVVDCSNPEEAGTVLRSAKAGPVNNRAIAIVLVESQVGLRGGFEMGAHFVLHKPLSGERAKASFRAVRALMKRERRRQLRVPVQIPVECRGLRSSNHYSAKTIDICEGGMAIQFTGRFANENPLRFSLELPGMQERLQIEGELAWEGDHNQTGIRFKNISEEQRNTLRQWLGSQLPEPEQEDPPVSCRLTDLSLGGCYLKTTSPFPPGTRVILSIKTADLQVRAGGVVRVTHSEYGMGVEFIQATARERDQVHQMIETLRANGDKSPELQVEPDELEPASTGEGEPHPTAAGTEDALVELFRLKPQAPVEAFLQQMREQRQSVDSH